MSDGINVRIEVGELGDVELAKLKRAVDIEVDRRLEEASRNPAQTSILDELGACPHCGADTVDGTYRVDQAEPFRLNCTTCGARWAGVRNGTA